MESKKFILNPNNLDIVNFIQHIVLINISTYKEMIKSFKDFTDRIIRHEFELKCERYLDLHKNYSIYDWKCSFDEIRSSHGPLTNKYEIIPDIKSFLFIYHVIIDLEKTYSNCTKLGIQYKDQYEQPVSINIFNVQFVKE